MGLYINKDTGSTVLYHGSKRGIVEKITPDQNENTTDFGNGFYLGTKELQTMARVSNEKTPYAYQFQISDEYINDENCIDLSDEDWVYFVLYNRGKLEDIKGTHFYEKYATLADGKDFIIGPIADDVYDKCIRDFCENNITDYTFKQLIDCFDYGIQIVAKTQRACDVLEKVSEKLLTPEDKKEILGSRKLVKKERVTYYDEKKAELNTERKGKFFSEIKNDIRLKESESLNKTAEEKALECQTITAECNEQNANFKNIRFPDKIHEREGISYGLF